MRKSFQPSFGALNAYFTFLTGGVEGSSRPVTGKKN
jgi:hypothetical protein